MNKYDKNKLQVLLGTKCETSILYTLCSNDLILKNIFDILDKDYEKHVKLDETGFYIINEKYTIEYNGKKLRNLRFKYKFPEPRNININMMPVKFPFGIPEEYYHYMPLITSCPGVFSKYNQILYLTIHESIVEPNTTQRRPGLHIEVPLGENYHNGKGDVSEYTIENRGIDYDKYFKSIEKDIEWGSGMFVDNTPLDGIYMMSSVSDSCAIYDCKIDKEQDVIRKHGDISHLRKHIGKERLLKANELVWFTDKTPHEALIVNNDKPYYRQFFRLVVGPISHWYKKHNTPNPLGICADAIIVDDDKFA
jgi:hypothetical protein